MSNEVVDIALMFSNSTYLTRLALWLGVGHLPVATNWKLSVDTIATMGRCSEVECWDHLGKIVA